MIGTECCIVGASERGGFGGGNGGSKGAPCEGCIELEEGANAAAFTAVLKGGGTKNDGLMSVARTLLEISGVSKERGGAGEVSGRDVEVGEMIEGMDMGARVGDADNTERDGNDCVVVGHDPVVWGESEVLIRTAFCGVYKLE